MGNFMHQMMMLSTRVIGRMDYVMVRGFSFIKMVPFMREILRKGLNMAKEKWSILQKIFMKDNGNSIKNVDLAK